MIKIKIEDGMNNTKESILCDNCGEELITNTPYPANYSLALSAINTNRNNSGTEFAVLIHPPIDDTKHFCDKKCLTEWLT